MARYDNLYRGVGEALYGEEEGFTLEDKPAILARLKEDGFWLIDAVEHPINKTSRAARQKAIAAEAHSLMERCKELTAQIGVIICHGLVYEVVADRMRDAGVTVLHHEPIPFPWGNWRKEFVTRFREALR